MFRVLVFAAVFVTAALSQGTPFFSREQLAKLLEESNSNYPPEAIDLILDIVEEAPLCLPELTAIQGQIIMEAISGSLPCKGCDAVQNYQTCLDSLVASSAAKSPNCSKDIITKFIETMLKYGSDDGAITGTKNCDDSLSPAPAPAAGPALPSSDALYEDIMAFFEANHPQIPRAIIVDLVSTLTPDCLTGLPALKDAVYSDPTFLSLVPQCGGCGAVQNYQTCVDDVVAIAQSKKSTCSTDFLNGFVNAWFTYGSKNGEVTGIQNCNAVPSSAPSPAPVPLSPPSSPSTVPSPTTPNPPPSSGMMTYALMSVAAMFVLF